MKTASQNHKAKHKGLISGGNLHRRRRYSEQSRRHCRTGGDSRKTSFPMSNLAESCEDPPMDDDEGQPMLSESDQNAARTKEQQRSSLELDHPLPTGGGRRRRRSFPSMDKRYWFAFSLPALLLIIYLTTDVSRWFGFASDLKVELPQEQMREAELRALFLLRKQQQGLLRLWNYTAPNSTSHTASNATTVPASNNTLSPGLPAEFTAEILSQIMLNQEVQQALLSSHQVGNASDFLQFGIDTAFNPHGGSANKCKLAAENVQRRTLDWKPRPERYLVAICLSGQMSNHLICLEKHMFFAALLNRILVLPSPKFDYQYEHVLDIQHMKDCLGNDTVITHEEFDGRMKGHLHINRLICYIATPPCYMDETHMKKFKDLGWSIGRVGVAWPDDAHHKGYPSHPHADEIVKKFSSDDKVIAVGELFFADVEEKWVTQPGGPLAHKCKNILEPNRYIVLTAQRFVQTFLGANFIALHFRRHGFLQFCNQKEHSCFFPIPQAASCILRKLQMTNSPVIYLSTDAAESETGLLQSFLVLNGQTIPLVKRPVHDSREKWDALIHRHVHLNDQVFAMLDKSICALASVFIGTSGSTFTDDIIRLRRDWRTASTCDEYLCQGETPNFQADLH